MWSTGLRGQAGEHIKTGEMVKTVSTDWAMSVLIVLHR